MQSKGGLSLIEYISNFFMIYPRRIKNNKNRADIMHYCPAHRSQYAVEGKNNADKIERHGNRDVYFNSFYGQV